jgi:gliding motility-associated-like protein
VYQAVCGGCGATSAFPTTPGAWSSTNRSGNCNNAAFKFDFNIITAVAGSNQTVCANVAPFQLTGFSPATGGTWSGTGVSPTGMFTPGPDLVGTITLSYTVANGSCVSTSTKTMTVNPAEPVSFTGLPPQLCLPLAPITLVPSVAGGSFTGPGMNANTFDPAAAGNGSHTITFSFTNAFGCTVTSSQVVQVHTMPAVVAGPDERLCSGSFPLMLSGFSPAGGTWSGTGVNAAGLFSPSDAIAGTHVLSYTISNGLCTVTQTKTVIVDPTIKFTQGPALTLCPDGPAQAITDIIPAGGSWTGNGISATGLFTPTAGLAGTQLLTYFVQVGACSGISTKEVTVSSPPVLNAAAVPTECGGPGSIQGFAPFTATFTNASTGASAYLWEFGDGGTSSEAIPSHQYTKDGNYEIYLTCFYGNGCRVRQRIAIAQVDKKEMIPNVFTPNGDGVNETFVPRVTCLSTDLKIFNRWGKLVYEQKNYQHDWGGQQVTDGIYYYQLTSAKGQIWKGWVEIIR